MDDDIISISANTTFAAGLAVGSGGSGGCGTSNRVTSNDISISRSYGTLYIAQAIEELQQRMCIVEPNFKKMENYPALKEAYDNYKLVESLINEGNNND